MWLSDSHSAFLFFPVPNPFCLVIPIDIIISLSLFFLLHNLHRAITFYLKLLIKMCSWKWQLFPLKYFVTDNILYLQNFIRHIHFFLCQWNMRKSYVFNLLVLPQSKSLISRLLPALLTIFLLTAVLAICLRNHKERVTCNRFKDLESWCFWKAGSYEPGCPSIKGI